MCQKGDSLRIMKQLKMVCKDNTWVPKEVLIKPKKNKGDKKEGRAKLGDLPCEDSLAQGTCQKNRADCLQYTKKGQEMEKSCAGTCGKDFSYKM